MRKEESQFGKRGHKFEVCSKFGEVSWENINHSALKKRIINETAEKRFFEKLILKRPENWKAKLEEDETMWNPVHKGTNL